MHHTVQYVSQRKGGKKEKKSEVLTSKPSLYDNAMTVTNSKKDAPCDYTSLTRELRCPEGITLDDSPAIYQRRLPMGAAFASLAVSNMLASGDDR